MPDEGGQEENNTNRGKAEVLASVKASVGTIDLKGEPGQREKAWKLWRDRFERVIRWMAVSGTDKLDLFLLVGGKELQKLIETLLEQPTNYESHIQEFNTYFKAHRNNTLELYKFFNIEWPSEVPFAKFETKCREQGLHVEFPITKENAIIMLALIKTKYGGLRNELIRKNGDLKLVRETAKAFEMAKQGSEMMVGDNCAARGGDQQSLKDRHEVHKITRPGRYSMRNNRPDYSSGRPTTKLCCSRCGNEAHPNGTTCPAWGKNCLKCRRGNPFARVCPSSQPNGLGRQVRAIEERTGHKHETTRGGNIGKLKGVTVELHVVPEAPGAIQKQRRISIPLKKKFDKILDRWHALDIIEDVGDEPRDWCSNVVLTPKKDGESVRASLDMTDVNNEGISPDPNKVAALQAAGPPQSQAEVRSFFFFAGANSDFMEGFAQVTAPLRNLIKQGAPFQWTPECQRAFEQTKTLLSGHTVMAYFDPHRKTKLVTDAGPHGLAVTLKQYDPQARQWRPVTYRSRALTNTKTRYSQLEKEAKAVEWGVLTNQIYLYGLRDTFEVDTHHKPLLPLFAGHKVTAPLRIERMRVRLQGFDYKLNYVPGKKAKAETNEADYNSRHPKPLTTPDPREVRQTKLTVRENEDVFEKDIRTVVQAALPDALSWDELLEETSQDPELKDLKSAIAREYFTISERQALGPQFYPGFTELAVVGGLVVRGCRIVVPRSLRDKVVHLAHEGHQGVTKTKEYLRSRVWFPVSISTRGYLLVVICKHSRWVEVEFVSTTSVRAVVPKLDRIFSSLGIPLILGSDNGPPFNGQEFRNFSTYLGFTHEHKTPKNPQANGEAEQFMRVLKKLYRICQLTGKVFRQEVHRFLRCYRATPHGTTKLAPAELMFPGHRFRTRLPVEVIPRQMDFEELFQRDLEKKMQLKAYPDRKRNVKTSDIDLIHKWPPRGNGLVSNA
ncbi:Retrovirus-related Pol polyprotein [Stylophora pistillata]|uniref:Retrovirus-related Pol polyprotein n=1 Tax=Stylophora pistillata TaxID=50429 RepID=A0A2B4RY85_STYPI|nr:Retrovirus-related Pol polyprotein [Stylophora pistillata]